MNIKEIEKHIGLPKKNEVNNSSYDLLYAGIDLKKEIGGKGTSLLIPRVFLHGRQAQDEYSNFKRRRIIKMLRRDGLEYLKINPVICCAIPVKNESVVLGIIDGHHRNRYSGLFKIQEIPCLVADIDTILEIINNTKAEGEIMEREKFIKKMLQDIGLASADLPERKQPISIFKAKSVDDLKLKFKSF